MWVRVFAFCLLLSAPVFGRDICELSAHLRMTEVEVAEVINQVASEKVTPEEVGHIRAITVCKIKVGKKNVQTLMSRFVDGSVKLETVE